MSARLSEVGVVIAAAVLLTLVIAAPLVHAPSQRIFGMESVGRHHDPFTVMEQFAGPISLGVYAQPLTDIPGALLSRVLGPVAAYNWLVLLTFPLSAGAAYLLARYVALSPGAAGFAAIAFAFSPFHLAHAAYHPHVAQVEWMPLYFLALWTCLDRGTPTAVAFLAASVAGVALSNDYGGLIAAVITPVAAAAHWTVTSQHNPRAARRLLLTLAILVLIGAAGGALAWYGAHDVLAGPLAVGFPRGDLFRYSAKWWSYLVPPLAHPLLGAFARRLWISAGVDAGMLEQQVSIGVAVLALAAVAIAAWGHNRRDGALPVVPALAVIAGAALICSLSPERKIGPVSIVRPSAVIYQLLPVFRAYARFGVVVQLMAVLLAGIGADWLWRRRTRAARVVCGILLVLAAAEYAVWPPAMSRDVLPTLAHRWVAEQPNDIHVLDCTTISAESRSLPWLSGYRIALSRGALDDCLEPNFVDKLSAAGYSHLLVRSDTTEGRWLAARPTPRGLQRTAHFRDGDVFAVTQPIPVVYTIQMRAFYSREHDDRWTWRWMGPAGSWGVVNTSDHGVTAALDVQMAAFGGPRELTVRLDGTPVQTVTVRDGHAFYHVGPVVLTPGDHGLAFDPRQAPTVAGAFARNGDSRALSIAIGEWQWSAAPQQP